MRRVLVLLTLSLGAVGLLTGMRPNAGAATHVAPALEQPAAGAVLPQNNVVTCTVYGHAWEFRWSAVAEAAHYELRITHDEAVPPVYGALKAATNERTVARCGCLPESMLDGWGWAVRAVAADGAEGPWSAQRPFAVERFVGCGSIYVEQ